MVVRDSKTSRAARWLRNKWYAEACPKCRIPEWKLQKYASTHFNRGYGSHLGTDRTGRRRTDRTGATGSTGALVALPAWSGRRGVCRGAPLGSRR